MSRVATAALVVCAFLVLLPGCGRDERAAGRAAAFHGAVGGLGSGPALDLTDGRAHFDARLGTEPFSDGAASRAAGAGLRPGARRGE